MHLRDADDPPNLGLAKVAEIAERDDVPLATIKGMGGRGNHGPREALLIERLAERQRIVQLVLEV